MKKTVLHLLGSLFCTALWLLMFFSEDTLPYDYRVVVFGAVSVIAVAVIPHLWVGLGVAAVATIAGAIHEPMLLFSAFPVWMLVFSFKYIALSTGELRGWGGYKYPSKWAKENAFLKVHFFLLGQIVVQIVFFVKNFPTYPDNWFHLFLNSLFWIFYGGFFVLLLLLLQPAIRKTMRTIHRSKQETAVLRYFYNRVQTVLIYSLILCLMSWVNSVLYKRKMDVFWIFWALYVLSILFWRLPLIERMGQKMDQKLHDGMNRLFSGKKEEGKENA